MKISKGLARAVLFAAIVPALPAGAASLTHRYSFTSDASDSVPVGTANGTLVNGATVSGNKVVLNNTGSSNDVTTGQYVDLPNGIVSNTTSYTIEGWSTWGGGGDWQRIFDFGTGTKGEHVPGDNTTAYDGTSYFFVSPKTGGDAGNGRQQNFGSEEKDGGGSDYANAPTTAGNDYGSASHFALTRSGATMTLYKDGMQVGQTTTGSHDTGTASLVNDWIGRSNWQGDPFYNGSIDEFRIFDGALTPAQISTEFANGPNGTPVPEPSALALLGVGALALLKRRQSDR